MRILSYVTFRGRAWYAAIAVTLIACSSTIHPYSLPPVRDSAARDELRLHAIFVNNDGEGVAPRADHFGRTLDPNAYGAYVGNIMNGIRRHVDSGYPDVLIRIHGGLNSFRESQATTFQMDSTIKADSAARIFPLFINWESGILESYGDHLFFVRQGRTGSLGILGAPFYFVADIGRALTRSPIVLTGQLRRALSCLSTQDVAARPDSVTVDAGASARDVALQKYLELEQCSVVGALEDSLYPFEGPSATGATVHRPGPRTELLASRFAYHRSTREAIQYYLASAPLDFVPLRTWVSLSQSLGRHHFSAFPPVIRHKTNNGRGRFATDLANGLSWLPLKSIGVILLDAVGTPAFENMRRRTKTMFQQPYSAIPTRSEAPRLPKPGAVKILFDSLRVVQSERRASGRVGYDLTLIGHSMGAIVANEALRTNPSLDVKNVVYMAAALTLREFQTGTVPYLQLHPSTQFFNLSLHPLADVRETAYMGTVPSGSLLLWLDGYLTSPESELDRMMGKYVVMTEGSFIIPPEIRTRVHLKAFGYRDGTGCGPDELPYKHGQFNAPGVPYWDRRFWTPGEACPDSLHLYRARVATH